MRIGILISGRGSNMLALALAVDAGLIPGAEIVVVISDRSQAAGVKLAAERGLRTVVVERRGRSRLEHEGELLSVLTSLGVELICLAGYMRLLSRDFIAAFRGRVLNIHPSLLPAFPGLEAQRQALEHGVKWTGCTVHFVDETLDGGPIIEQQAVPIFDEDTPETLAARILIEEHQLYPKAVARIVRGDYEIVGRRIVSKSKV